MHHFYHFRPKFFQHREVDEVNFAVSIFHLSGGPLYFFNTANLNTY